MLVHRDCQSTDLLELNDMWVHQRPMVHDFPLHILCDLH